MTSSRSWLLLGLLAACGRPPAPPVVVLTATADEAEPVEAGLMQVSAWSHGVLTGQRGRLGGIDVLVVSTGVGKVRAAATTARLVDAVDPTAIWFSGIAGGLAPDLVPGDLVVGTAALQHDAGHLTDAGMERRPAPSATLERRDDAWLAADAGLVGRAMAASKGLSFEALPLLGGARAPTVREGRVATGDVFVAAAAASQALRDETGADVVEMEGAAVAEIAAASDTPWVLIRAVSDRADGSAVEDEARFYELAGRNAARLALAGIAGGAP